MAQVEAVTLKERAKYLEDELKTLGEEAESENKLIQEIAAHIAKIGPVLESEENKEKQAAEAQPEKGMLAYSSCLTHLENVSKRKDKRKRRGLNPLCH